MESSILSQSAWSELTKKLVAEYDTMLSRMNVKKKDKENLTAGFSEGLSTAVRHLVGMGVIKVVEDAT